ncbi:MAG TPA: hypothetical protein VGO50_03160 [Pyrinomonadaceae bacterium]|jgi:hypothetical protein|nr:hypothetical protein [Pyrinomonadaceae bacterium]
MKNKIAAFIATVRNSRVVSKNLRIKALVFLMICFCIVGISGVKVTSQDEEIIVHKKFGEVPVKLVSVSAEKKEVALEKAFAKTDGWFKGLEFEIENTSGKTITCISLQLRFDRPKEFKESSGSDKYGFSMVIPYGDVNDFMANKATGVEIKPGETVKIPLKENYYNTLNGSLLRLGYPSKFKGVEIVIHEIGFSDEILWSYGLFYKRDPENSVRWAPILEKK